MENHLEQAVSVDESGPDIYRWTCPVCGKTSIRALDVSCSRRRAIATLKSHVLSSDGDGHGSRHELPAEYDIDALADHVQCISGG